MNTLSFMMNGRNQLFMEPFDVFDPHHPLRGKKRFNSNFRPLRSKINLNIGGEAVDTSKKKRDKVTVKESFLEEFEKRYAENCNQQFMRIKNRNVSYDSPFDPKNVPPNQYIQPEKILEKPCKLDLTGIDSSKVPLAGRLGQLGKEILKAGSKAKHLTTGPWKEEQFADVAAPRVVMGKKPPNKIADKLTGKTQASETK